MPVKMKRDIKSSMNFIGGILLIFIVLENILMLLLFAVGDLIFPMLSLNNTILNILDSLLTGVSYVISYFLANFICKKMLGTDYLPPKYEKKLGSHPVAMSFAVLGSIMFVARLFSLFGTSASGGVPSYHGENIPLQMFITVLVPAFCEELMFRGIVLTNLLPFGKRFAVIASAIIFGLIHGNHDQIFFAFVAGILLGLLYTETGSIWCGVLVHMFNNFISLIESVLIFNIRACLILETIPIILGAISLIYLVSVKKKERNTEVLEGAFGSISPKFTCVRRSFDTRDAVKSFFTPTMIVFYVYVLISEVMYVLLF